MEGTLNMRKLNEAAYRCVLAMLIAALGLSACREAGAQTFRVRDICRLMGQEENTLQGLGLVVGLKGTGDSNSLPTIRALASMMKLMGNPVGQTQLGDDVLEELASSKNVALVFVSATVPPTGAPGGTKLHCTVSSVSAKSLEGGQLMMTALLGPQRNNGRVYAFAQGQLTLENSRMPNVAKIYQGAKLEESFYNQYTRDGYITLVLDPNHASIRAAQEIADQINSQFKIEIPDYRLAKAVDAANIVVRIPDHDLQDPAVFVSQVLDQRIYNLQNDARVVINERAGTIVIGGDVQIAPVAITHESLVVEAGRAPTPEIQPIDQAGNSGMKLKSLVDALGALKVPTSDMIEIIKTLKRNGDLYGDVIVE